jgi:hypothetical protein
VTAATDTESAIGSKTCAPCSRGEKDRMLTKEQTRLFLGKDQNQLKRAINKFCTVVEKLIELRDEMGDAGFVAEDFAGYLDPNEFEGVIQWLAEIHVDERRENQNFLASRKRD